MISELLNFLYLEESLQLQVFPTCSKGPTQAVHYFGSWKVVWKEKMMLDLNSIYVVNIAEWLD